MIQQSKIAILGFGVEGRAIFEWLRKHNYTELTVCDENVDLKKEMPDGVSVRLGPDYLNDLTDFEVVFRSPGIKYLAPEIQNALNNGVAVTSSTAFFLDQCPCPVVGVTGTNGKGTTATLVYNMLKAGKLSGKKVFLGGNIGESPMTFLDNLDGDDLAVLELSSFQLQDLKKSPRYVVLLNTTSDHLDYHADSDEYLLAKESILRGQHKDCLAVLNKDYEYYKYYQPLVRGELREVSTKTTVADGAYVKDDEIFHAIDGEEEKICSVKDIGLVGAHNVDNVLPAVVIAKELLVDTSTIQKVIKDFKGLEHRLEFVKQVDGVKYYNDSNATSPEASMAAVDSFDEPTALIAGGYFKGKGGAEWYKDWAVKILTKPNLHHVVLMGDTAEAMEEALHTGREQLGEAEGSETHVYKAKDLKEAVEKAAEVLDSGVCVMSPAAQSFDLFKNYKDRGDKFKKAVKKL